MNYKQLLDKVKRIKNFHLVIVPDSTSSTSRSKEFSLTSFLTIIIIYTVLVGFIGFFALSLTPLRKIYDKETNLSNEDVRALNQLSDKIRELSDEVEKLKRTNNNLKRIIETEDSIKNLRGGSIITILRYLLGNIYQEFIYFNKPINGYISKKFIPEKGHMGIDFAVKVNTPIYAAASGFVSYSGYNPEDGFFIIIQHPQDYTSVYKHCSMVVKNTRDKVIQGELIALSGNSGTTTTGPHLHFEIWKNGSPIDPATMIINF